MRQDHLDYFLHSLGMLYRVRRIYVQGQKQVGQAAKQAVQRLTEWGESVRITLLGDDVFIEDRRVDELPSSFEALFQALRQSGCESVQIRADAGEDEFLAWIEHVISKERAPFRGSKIVAGARTLERRTPHSPSVLAQAVAGYLEFLSQAQEAFSELEEKKAEGLLRAKEIVRAILARLALGKELFEPIRELKDYDDYTFTHALNVCLLSSALAQTLGLPKDLIQHISLAALCHDLGKKHVPKEIINKPGPLEPKEWIFMEEHPAHGARLLLEMSETQSETPLLPVVAFQHHMGADQSGYPRLPNSLKPHLVHSVSLLVTVADVFDALRTVRPYRPALSIAAATTVLIKGVMSGKLNREYVSAMLLLMKILVPGRRVVLSDGTQGVIAEIKPGSPLTPKVSSEGGLVIDLSKPSSPWLSEVLEAAA